MKSLTSNLPFADVIQLGTKGQNGHIPGISEVSALPEQLSQN